MAGPYLNAGNIGVAYPSSSQWQPAQPNLAAHTRPNVTTYTTLGIPQVSSPPKIKGQSTTVSKILLGLSRWADFTVLISRFSG